MLNFLMQVYAIMAVDWHSSPDFLKCVRDFHDNHARQPKGPTVDRAKQVLNQYLAVIRTEMDRQGVFLCTRYEFRGSGYEGVKVAKNGSDQDLEFDIMFVIKGGTDLEEHGRPGNDGYVNLRPKVGRESRPAFQKTMRDGCVSAAETRNKFHGQLIKCNLSQLGQCDIKYNGPALRIDVKEAGRLFFSIDLAPHYDLTGQGQMYVPKAPYQEPACNRWFRTYSLQEKEKLDGLDRDNGCRKMVLRITKAMRKRTSELAPLKSSQLKTALFRVMDIRGSWRQDELGVRLMEVLKRLEDDLTAGYMSRYYLPEANLFEKFSRVTMENMAGRLKRLGRNKSEMMELIRP